MVSKHGERLRNVVIISLDCVRPEALGCYPQRFPLRFRLPRPLGTPNIDHLAASGHRFDQAITQAPFTSAAHASLFTGLIPPKHGVRTILGSCLAPGVTTLAEVLSAEGWKCGAVVGSHALAREFGLCKGFDHYDDDIDTGMTNWLLGQRRDAAEVTEQAVEWLGSVRQHRVFLFVHYFDAHDVHKQASHGVAGDSRQSRPLSLAAPGSLAARSVKAVARPLLRLVGPELNHFEIGPRYSGYGRRFMLRQVAKIDDGIGRLLTALSAHGELSTTLIVVLADHGDDFMEHGEPSHRMYLYDTTLRVPLIIYPKMGEGATVSSQVRIVDIFPSILDLLRIADEGITTDGASLRTLLEARSATHGLPRPAYAETLMESTTSEEAEIVSCFAALRKPPWKLVWDRLRNQFELYNIESDPRESSGFGAGHEHLVATLRPELMDLAADMPVSRRVADDDIIVQRLKGLGYL